MCIDRIRLHFGGTLKGGEMEMNDIEGLWLGICLVAFVVVATVTVLFAVTWEKIDLIYDIVKKKRLDGDNHD